MANSSSQHSVTIIANLIDNISKEAKSAQNSLNALEKTRKQVEEAEKRGDADAAKRRANFEQKLKASNKRLEQAHKDLGEARKQYSKLLAEQERQDTAVVQEGAKQRTHITRAESEKKIEAAKAEKKEREELAKGLTAEVEETERRLTVSHKHELAERLSNTEAANAERVKSHRETENRITMREQEEIEKRARIHRSQIRDHDAIVQRATYRDALKAKLEYNKANRKAIREENELYNISKKQRLERERSRSVVSRFRYELEKAEEAGRQLTVRLSRVGLAVRGLAVALGIAFSRALISILGTLAGQAVAVGSSVIYAAGAIGGAFTAAVAQAIPMVALLAGAMQRLSIIQDAVNQYDLNQKQQFGDTSAADTAIDNSNAMADAQDRVKEAQEGVTKARREATKELRDLILAEKEAALAFERSKMSQEQSRRSLRDRIASGEGSLLELEGDQLSVRESNVDVNRSRYGLSDAREELRKARSGGIKGMDTVKNATKELADAQKALAEAHRGAATAANTQSAAESNLNYFLSQLTDTERKLFNRFIGFRDKLQKVMTPMTDTIFGSLLKGMNKLEGALFSPQIIGAFEKLSGSMGGGLTKLINVVTSPASVKFWTEIIGESSKNLGPMSRILTNIYKLFMNIARAGGPAFREILEIINDTFGDLVKKTGKNSAISKFFADGVKHFKAWWQLLGGVMNLVGALMGASGQSALKTISDITDRINKAAGWLRDNRKEAQAWFDDTSKGFGYLLDIVERVGLAVIRLTDSSHIEVFSELLDDIFIPALETTVETVSILVKGINELLDIPFAKDILKWLLTFKLVASSSALLGSVLGGLFRPISLLVNTFFPKLGTAFRDQLLLMAYHMEDWGRATRTKMITIGRRLAASLVSRMSPTLATQFVEQGVGATLLGKFRGLSRRMKVVGGILGVAIVAGIAFALTTPESREQFVLAAGRIGAWFVDTLISVINKGLQLIVDGISGGMIGDILDKAGINVDAPQIDFSATDFIKDLEKQNKEYWKQQREIERRRKSSEKFEKETGIGTSIHTSEGAGRIPRQNQTVSPAIQKRANNMLLESGFTREQIRSMKEASREIDKNNDKIKENTKATARNREAKDNNSQSTKRLTDRNKDLGDNIKNARQRQQDQNAVTKTGWNFMDNLRGSINKTERKQKDFGDETKRTTKRQDEQREGARRLGKGLGGLVKNFSGTAKKSRGLGDMIKQVTNRVLKSFGVDEIKFQLPSLNSIMGGLGDLVGLETGGYFGNKTDRGPDDRVIKVAGGEAILTGFQQQEANRAFAVARAVGGSRYGSLDEMFTNDKRLHRYAPGFESGGNTNRTNSPTGGAIQLPQSVPDAQGALPGLDLMAYLANKYYGLTVSPGGGIRSPGTMTSSGNISDHTWGGAVDLSNGYAPTPEMDAAWFWFAKVLGGQNMSGFIEDFRGGAIKQMLYRTNIGGNHFNHIHLALSEQYARNIEALTQILTGAAVPVGTGNMIASIPKIPKIKIKGPEGALMDQLMGQEKTLRQAANEYIASQAPMLSGSATNGVIRNIRSFDDINHIFAEHNSAEGDWGGPKLPHRVIAALAEAAGTPGETMADVTVGESGGRPGATGIDPGGTKGLGLWMITTGYNDAIIAKYGGEAAMRNPVQNAKAMAEIYHMPPAGLGTTKWYGAGNAVDGQHYTGTYDFGHLERGGIVPGFDKGGIIPGPLGMPRMIKAHGGEIVLPTHKNTFRDVMGFESGGNTDRREKRRERARLDKAVDIFDINIKKAPGKGLEELLQGFGDLFFKAPIDFKAKKSDIKKSIENFSKRLEDFYDGINEANAEYETFIAKQARWINSVIYKVRKGMNRVSKVKTDLQISQIDLNQLERQGEYLENQMKVYEVAERRLRKELRRTPRDQKDQREKLRHAINKLENTQDEVTDKINENMQARLEAQNTVFDNIINRIDVKRSAIDTKIAIQEALGEIKMGEDDDINPRSGAIKKLIKQDTQALNRERRTIEKELRRAIRGGNKDRAREMRQALLDNRLAIIENNARLKELNNSTNDNTDATNANSEELNLSFTTTAWDQFRFAILNSMGGVNQNLVSHIPQLATGADKVTKSGLFQLHAGEAVINANGAEGIRNGKFTPGYIEQHNYFTEPMEIADPTAISNAIAFKTRQVNAS